MARTAAAPKPASDDIPPEGPPQVLPPDFSFAVSKNVPIPEKAARATPKTAHAFAAHFENMGHNDSIFVPLAYWLGRPGRTVDNTPPSWQKATISGLFVAFRKKAPEKRSNLRLTTIAREVGEDPEFPQLAGVRAWVVDTTR